MWFINFTKGRIFDIFFSLSFLLLFQKKTIKKRIIYFYNHLLVISPYLTRNYKTFGTLTITKSFVLTYGEEIMNLALSKEALVEVGDVISKIENEIITKDNYKEPETFGEYVNNDIFIDNFTEILQFKTLRITLSTYKFLF